MKYLYTIEIFADPRSSFVSSDSLSKGWLQHCSLSICKQTCKVCKSDEESGHQTNIHWSIARSCQKQIWLWQYSSETCPVHQLTAHKILTWLNPEVLWLASQDDLPHFVGIKTKAKVNWFPLSYLKYHWWSQDAKSKQCFVQHNLQINNRFKNLPSFFIFYPRGTQNTTARQISK